MCPRQRKPSESNLYHITFRGVAQRVIFETEDDPHVLVRLIRYFLREFDVEIYAWCLMSNHGHLLLHAEMNEISAFMQRLLSAYARYFNDKYERVGHLFQDRFGSVPVETDEQFLTTVRYIHRNPSEIPGLAYDSYEWSSFREYLHGPFVSKTEFALSIFGSIEEFIRFHEDWTSADEAIGHLKGGRLEDIDAVRAACNILGTETLTGIAMLDKPDRDDKIAILKEAGFSISQIARIAELNRNTVQRARRKRQRK